MSDKSTVKATCRELDFMMMENRSVYMSFVRADDGARSWCMIALEPGIEM